MYTPFSQVNPLGPRPAAALKIAMKSHVKRSNRVKWSQDTTLKTNNKHQTKDSDRFAFFPVCKYIVLECPTGLDFFTQK